MNKSNRGLDIKCSVCKEIFNTYDAYGAHIGDCAVENIKPNEDEQ